MYPETRSVVLRRANTALHLGGDEEIDLGPALPGFRAKVSELFPPPLEPGERVGTDDPEDGGSR
jgi:hypothetical protein